MIAMDAGTEAIATEEKKRGGRSVRRFTADLSATGEPFLWAFGGALALGIILIACFLAMIFWNGIVTFWPKPIEVVTLADGTKVAGEPSRVELFRPAPNVLQGLTVVQRRDIGADHRIVGSRVAATH